MNDLPMCPAILQCIQYLQRPKDSTVTFLTKLQIFSLHVDAANPNQVYSKSSKCCALLKPSL